MKERIDRLVETLSLLPHPEGGFYRETYRSEGVIAESHLGNGYEGSRNYATSIYFLLTSESFSAFHRIKQDEIWHFYDGAPLHLHIISPEGVYSKILVGKDIDKGEIPQATVYGGSWFASEVPQADSYALVGCTVSPGFDFRDFELARGQELSEAYPQHQEIIMRLTRE